MFVVRYEDIEKCQTVYYKYTLRYEGRYNSSKSPKFTDDIMKAKKFKTLQGAENQIFVLEHDYKYPTGYLSIEEI